MFDQYLIYIYSVVGFVALFLLFLWFIKRKRAPGSSLNLTLLLIRVQRVTEQKEEKERDRDFFSRQINRTEQLFSALASIKEPFTFECSVQHTNELINFYLAVPTG